MRGQCWGVEKRGVGIVEIVSQITDFKHLEHRGVEGIKNLHRLFLHAFQRDHKRISGVFLAVLQFHNLGFQNRVRGGALGDFGLQGCGGGNSGSAFSVCHNANLILMGLGIFISAFLGEAHPFQIVFRLDPNDELPVIGRAPQTRLVALGISIKDELFGGNAVPFVIVDEFISGPIAAVGFGDCPALISLQSLDLEAVRAIGSINWIGCIVMAQIRKRIRYLKAFVTLFGNWDPDGPDNIIIVDRGSGFVYFKLFFRLVSTASLAGNELPFHGAVVGVADGVGHLDGLVFNLDPRGIGDLVLGVAVGIRWRVGPTLAVGGQNQSVRVPVDVSLYHPSAARSSGTAGASWAAGAAGAALRAGDRRPDVDARSREFHSATGIGVDAVGDGTHVGEHLGVSLNGPGDIAVFLSVFRVDLARRSRPLDQIGGFDVVQVISAGVVAGGVVLLGGDAHVVARLGKGGLSAVAQLVEVDAGGIGYDVLISVVHVRQIQREAFIGGGQVVQLRPRNRPAIPGDIEASFIKGQCCADDGVGNVDVF